MDKYWEANLQSFAYILLSFGQLQISVYSFMSDKNVLCISFHYLDDSVPVNPTDLNEK